MHFVIIIIKYSSALGARLRVRVFVMLAAWIIFGGSKSKPRFLTSFDNEVDNFSELINKATMQAVTY